MKENKPLISFIIAYYNLPVEMLYKCIDSIIRLSLLSSEREIIVVDDGSDVSPMNELMKYGNEIIYIRQKNQGLSIARNKGIDMSTGTYIQFIDADDYLIPTGYELCLNIIRTNKQIEMVVFDFTTTDNSNQSTFNDLPVISGSQYMLKQNIYGTACGYFFMRKTLSELRFTPNIWHEDEEFTPQLLIRAERVCITDAKAYYYNKHTGTITTYTDKESIAKRLNDRKGVLYRLQHLCDRIPQSDRLALQRRLAQLTMDYIYQVIVQQRTYQALNNSLDELRSKGLFPLPNREYTKKYKWFRRMTNSSIGRTILLHTLPLMKKER